ncbi:MAG: DNA primase [Pseudomonadota bacterium]|nr:DNA primase [Pseudomonadota bacterium]
MSIETLLSKLDKVRRTGPDRWIASSPTRPDKHPSMTIRALPDGRILLYDHGGDGVHEILAAIGMDMADLFPPRMDAPGPGKPHRERRPFDPLDVLRVLDFETTIILRYGCGMARGESVAEHDLERLRTAVSRIGAARRLYAR